MDTPLTRELVAETSYLQMGLRIGCDSVDVMIYNPHEEHSLIHRHIPLASDGGDRLKELENVVYDNPLILADFHKTMVAVETSFFTVVPDVVSAPGVQRRLLAAACPDLGEHYEVVADPLPAFKALILSAIPSKEANFIRRTFNNVPMHSSLWALAKYCRGMLQMGNTVKTFVNLRDDSVDVLVMSHDRLYLANRFSFRTIDDLVYYILAITEPAGSGEGSVFSRPDIDATEICLMGSRPIREQLMPALRRFRSYVIPVIFPSAMYRAGAASLAAPFDLIILPLCN